MAAQQITPSMRAQRILKSARAAKGFTQQDVAKLMKVSRSLVQTWESDVFNMHLDKFIRLCKIYGIEPNQILEV